MLQLPHNEQTRPIVKCSSHMCPIRIHWHVKISYKEYWRVKITINNLNVVKNYSQWNLVVLHPNLQSLTQVFSFYYKPLGQYGSLSKLIVIFTYICQCKVHYQYACVWSILKRNYGYEFQMIRGCFMESIITMTCYFIRVMEEMYKARCCFTKTRGLLRLKKDGCFQGGLFSTVTNVWCLNHMSTRHFQTVVDLSDLPHYALWFYRLYSL